MTFNLSNDNHRLFVESCRATGAKPTAARYWTWRRAMVRLDPSTIDLEYTSHELTDAITRISQVAQHGSQPEIVSAMDAVQQYARQRVACAAQDRQARQQILDGTRVGHMTLDRWAREGHRKADHRVYLNGEDVTMRCVEFDDMAGYVVLLRHDAWGRSFLDPTTGSAAKERIEGTVEVRTPHGLAAVS
jgi:hypothetical protein